MKVSLLDLIKEIGDCGVYKEGVDVKALYEKLKTKYDVEVNRGRGRPRKSKMEKESLRVDKISFLVSEEQQECRDESIKVKKEVINEKVYLISECADVYDFESHDLIGSYKNGELILQ